ncbi:MAG: hypothetical protein AAGB93_13620 [Planctomycetota bacterium]
MPIERRHAVALLLSLFVASCSSSTDDGPGAAPEPEILAGAYLPEDGLIVVELESGDAAGNWAEETTLTGFTGASYLRWTGPNLFNTPGTDVFGFDLWVEDAGRYHFRIHNRHDDPDSTMSNDVWVRMDGGDWVKVFSSTRGVWTWTTRHEFDASTKPLAEYTLTRGNHRIEFSGRSNDFSIDRFHLYDDGVVDPLNTTHPESQPFGTGSAPPPSISYDVAALPRSEGTTSLVTLTASGGDEALEWEVGDALFADGTGSSDGLVRIVVPGGVARPVALRSDAGASSAFLQVEGAPARMSGAGRVGRRVELSGAGAVEITLHAPDGSSRAAVVHPVEGGWRARFRPSVPGRWDYVLDDGARGSFLVLP